MSIKVLYIVVFYQDPTTTKKHIDNIYAFDAYHFISHNTTIIVFNLRTSNTVIEKFDTLQPHERFILLD